MRPIRTKKVLWGEANLSEGGTMKIPNAFLVALLLAFATANAGPSGADKDTGTIQGLNLENQGFDLTMGPWYFDRAKLHGLTATVNAGPSSRCHVSGLLQYRENGGADIVHSTFLFSIEITGGNEPNATSIHETFPHPIELNSNGKSYPDGWAFITAESTQNSGTCTLTGILLMEQFGPE
jgi:hypothetical protein